MGKLPPQRRDRFDEHLTECVACRKYPCMFEQTIRHTNVNALLAVTMSPRLASKELGCCGAASLSLDAPNRLFDRPQPRGG